MGTPLRPAVLLVIASIPLFCCAQSGSLSLDEIVSRMQQAHAAERDRGLAYVVTREYQLGAAGAQQPSSQVLAQVSFVPPSQKQYAIVKAEGNERGARIVRKVLDHEISMAAGGQPHEISRANYGFALLGRESLDGRDCYVLQLSPKRDAVELIRGRAWVDAQDFQIRRIDGETAKSPSFWIKNVHLTLNFGEVNGVWLETATQATADVRLAGPHVLTSRELDVQTGSVAAKLSKPRDPRRRQPNIVADTAAWVAH